MLIKSLFFLALAAVISGIIDNKISSKEYVTTNVECIAREKSTDLSVLPISTGETYTAEIEIRTYPNSAKKEYDIISINTNNQQKRK